MIEALRDLGNALDDHGLPSMTVDHIRLEIVAMKVRHNNQPGNTNGTLEMADRDRARATAAGG